LEKLKAEQAERRRKSVQDNTERLSHLDTQVKQELLHKIALNQVKIEEGITTR
jgi:hypothetical protein